MRFKIAIAILLLLPCSAFATTYYVRTDGSTGLNCTGAVDAAYPGSGTNQACAWSHPLYALVDPADTLHSDWKISAGDTLLIKNGSYKFGEGAAGCTGKSCGLGIIPSGIDSDHPTIIAGENYNSGCTTMPELWGEGDQWAVMRADNSSHVSIKCLEITDHQACWHSNKNSESVCPNDGARSGIYTIASEDLSLEDIYVHGIKGPGFYGASNGFSVKNSRFIANGAGGFNLDSGTSNATTGSQLFDNVTVQWNGCIEGYPSLIHNTLCLSDGYNVYADGIGFPDTIGVDLTIKNSNISFNTQDGIDTLHVKLSNSLIERNWIEGNGGNALKTRSNGNARNNVIIGDCRYLMQYGHEDDNWCRAGGDTLVMVVFDGEVFNLFNNTITGNGALYQIEGLCENAGTSETCVSQTGRIYARNNLVYGQARSDGNGLTPAMVGTPYLGNATVSYNAVYGVSGSSGWNPSECPYATGDICADPKVLDPTVTTFNPHLDPVSPLIGAGLDLSSSGVTLDYYGNTRPSGMFTIGAIEYNSPLILGYGSRIRTLR